VLAPGTQRLFNIGNIAMIVNSLELFEGLEVRHPTGLVGLPNESDAIELSETFVGQG
jgi:hypothetical protein